MRDMKKFAKKCLPVLLIAALLVPCCSLTSCSSSKKNTTNGREVMYERPQTNKGSKVNSKIKVRGTNKRNRHTTRSY